MKKNTILYILLAFLIIVNGFFLVNYLGRPGKPDGQKGPGDFIVKALNFDDSQMERFLLLNENHHLKMKTIFERERQLKDELFGKMSESKINDSVIDSITTLIGNNSKLKDVTTFYFFKDIEKICNDKQKNRLDKLINEALRREGRSSGNPPPPPKHH